MIPPWSEAEQALVLEMAAQEERLATLVSIPHRTPEDRKRAARAAALRACLARAEQADRLEQERDAIDKAVGYPQGLDGLPLVERVVLACQQMRADDERCRVWQQEVELARQRAEQAEAELAAFKARSAASVEAMSTRIAELDAVRQQAEAERDEARDQVEHWRSHYEAAIFNWNQTIAERDEARKVLETVLGGTEAP